MKVLLCEDVESLGWLGDIVEVTDGYARNFLLPKGIAKPATKENIKAIEDEKTKRAEKRIRERKRLEQAAEKVKDAEAVIAAQANEQGHLFGSVGQKQIAQNLREQGFEVADEIVQLTSHIKETGTHTVSLKFADDLTSEIKVTVVAKTPESPQLDSM